MRSSRVIPVLGAIGVAAVATAAPPVFTGPLPYQSIADSPYFADGQTCYELETFPDGVQSEPGFQFNSQTGAEIVPGVGVPPGGYVLQANQLGVIELSFTTPVFEVGFVWTGGDPIGSTITMTVISSTEAISQQFASLAPNDPNNPADNRFFGVAWDVGIQQLRITFLPPGPGIPNQIDDIQFNSGAQPLDAPDPISPADGELTESSPTFIWLADPCATWYRLWVNDSTGNRLVQWYTAEEVGASTGICSVTPDIVLSPGAATWWLLAWNVEFGSGPWSTGSSFDVSSEPITAPVTIDPAGTATGLTPTYRWEPVASATWYQVWVNDSTGNRLIQWYTAAAVGANTGECSITPDIELALGNATWWVRAWNAAEGNGPWSAATTFVVGDALTAPVTIAPVGSITETTPTYRWEPVAAATWYQLWIDDSSGDRLVEWFTADEVGASSGECSITPNFTLTTGNGTWWVRAWNTDQGNGPWSAGSNFTVE